MKIGFLPTRRGNFSLEAAQNCKVRIKKQLQKSSVQLLDIEDVCQDGLLLKEQEIPAVINKMKKEEVEALFFPHCNFGCEGAVGQVAAALKIPTLLYAPRDEAPESDGMRTRDSQCGVFATGTVLRRHRIPFSYLTSTDPETGYFETGWKRFLRTAAVVNTMKNIRILQIGPRPVDFLSVMANEGELLEQFGIKIYPVPLTELLEEMIILKSREKDAVTQVGDWIAKKYQGKGVQDPQIRETLAAMKLAVSRLATRYRCNCGCIQCWSSLQKELNIFPCAVNSMLADEGFPIACETDIHGVISTMLLQAAADGDPPFLADLTIRHPTENNTELLWHCGAFPSKFARDPQKLKITEAWDGNPECGNCSWELQKGNITLCRFDGDYGEYSLFIGEGEGVEGPYTRGNYIWFKTQDWPEWEHKLVRGPYIHHVAGVYGNYGEVLLEACRYWPEVKADPAYPYREMLEKRWM